MRAGGRADGRTDRQTAIHDEANSHFLHFCERPESDFNVLSSIIKCVIQ
jgi:hypothetical protein